MGPFPEDMGDPEELYSRWKRYDLELIFKAVDRQFARLAILEREPKFWENFGPRPETERGDFGRRVPASPDTPFDVYVKRQLFLESMTEIMSCPPKLCQLGLLLAGRPQPLHFVHKTERRRKLHCTGTSDTFATSWN